MTYSYDLTNTIGQIRLMIGDITLTDPIFTDEEITYFISVTGDLNLAAAACCNAWAAKYGANADSEHIGDYSYSQSIVDKLLKIAATFTSTATSTPAMDWGSFNLTGVEDTDDDI